MIRRHTALALLLAGLAAVLPGCEGSGSAGDPRAIEVWFHLESGPERDLLEQQALRFNRQSDDLTVLLRVLPGGDHTAQVAEAALDGTLPALVDIEPGAVGSLVPADVFADLEPLLGPTVLSTLRPAGVTAGRVDDRLRVLPLTTDAVVMVGERRVLRQSEVALPGGLNQRWRADAAARALRQIAEVVDGPVLQIGDEVQAEVVTALVAAAGGSLAGQGSDPVRRHLDGPAAVQALTLLQSWAAQGWLATPAIHEEAPEVETPLVLTMLSSLSADHAAGGGSRVVLPLPDLGAIGTIGLVDTGWAIPADHPDADAAAEFLRFLASPAEVEASIEVTGRHPLVAGVAEAHVIHGVDGSAWFVREAIDDGRVRRRRASTAQRLIDEALPDLLVPVLVDRRPVRAVLAEAADQVGRTLASLAGDDVAG